MAGLGFLLRRAAYAALALSLSASVADAATLYITELANGVSAVGTTLPPVAPQPSITDQTVALSGASAASAAFNSKTRVIAMVCDEGCSVTFGATPTATTSSYLLQQGVPYEFGVVPGQKVAAIANAAGNTGGAGGTTVTANQGTPGSIDAGWPVSDSQAVDTSGTITASAQSVTASNTDGFAQVTVTISGTYAGISGAFEQSEDSATTWYPAKCTQTDTPFTTGNSFTTLTNTSRLWHCPTNGADAFRVRSTAYSSGTANVRISISAFPIADSMTDIISPNQVIGIDQTTPGTTNGVQTLTGSVTTATLAAETTKVIGTVNQGTSPWIVAGGGTAGSAASGVVSVQGVASMTPVQVAGTVADGAAVGGNPVPAGAAYNSTLPTYTTGQRSTLQTGSRGSLNVSLYGGNLTNAATITSAGDGAVSTPVALSVSALPALYNGTTVDRARSVVNATDSTGTGIQAVGNLAQLDDTSPGTVTENQFGNMRMSADRSLNVAPDAYASSMTPETASSGNVANASAAATLAASSGKTTYISGFQCTPGGAVSAAEVTVTVVGVITGTMSYIVGAPVGVAVVGAPLIVQFSPPVPASTTNTTIVVTMPALGTGNTNAACSAQGYQQ